MGARRLPGKLKQLWLIVERDVRLILQYRAFLVMRWLWYFIQVTVFGVALSMLVNFENYFAYYAAGIYVATLYSTAIFTAYDIAEEAEHGFVDYLLSLPIERRLLEVGRAVGGGLRSMLVTAPPLLFTLYAVGIRDVVTLISSAVGLFLLAFGVAGLGILIVSALKSADKTDIVLGIIDAFIVRLSTVFYPKAFMPVVYASISMLNPLTYASEMFRWGLGVPFYEVDPAASLVALLAFATSMTWIGILFYERRLEAAGWA